MDKFLAAVEWSIERKFKDLESSVVIEEKFFNVSSSEGDGSVTIKC